MSDSQIRSSAELATFEDPLDHQNTGLHGSLGTLRLAAMVMAFVSPLVTVSGYMAILIIFGGIGVPAQMIAAMVLVAVFSVGFIAMGHHMSNPGAFYSYITAGLGRVAGLGAAFVAVATYVCLMAGTTFFFGLAGSNFVVTDLHGPSIEWYWYSLFMVSLVAIFGYLNIEFSAKVLLVAMSIEVVIITIFDIAVFAEGGMPGTVSLEPFSWSAFTGGSFGVALLFAILFFNGFEATAIFREEVRNPARTIGRATFLIVFFVGLFYAVTSWAMITYYGTDNTLSAASNDPVTLFETALRGSVGSWLANISSVILLSSIFAAITAIHNIIARYFYSLGVDRVLPAVVARVHPRSGSPYVGSFLTTALLGVIVVTCVIAGSDPTLLYGELGGVGGYGYLVLFTLTSLAVLSYFAKAERRKLANKWVTVVAPMLSFLGMGAILVVAINHFEILTGGSGIWAVIFQAIIWGAGIVGCAVAIACRRWRPKAYARIGRQIEEEPVSVPKSGV